MFKRQLMSWIRSSVQGSIYRRSIAFLLVGLFSFLSSLSLPARSIPAIAPTSQANSSISNLQSLIQQGITFYESERFSEAVTVWEQARSRLTTQQDDLMQVIVLSHLSLAYQQLGQWQEAETAIAQAQDKLQQQKNVIDEQAYAAIQAKLLNAQGRLQWSRGQFTEAAYTWKQATAAYEQAGDETGIIMGLLNQATALQEIGISLQAEAQLEKICTYLHPTSSQGEVKEQEEETQRLAKCQSLLQLGQNVELPVKPKVILYRNLGIAFRRIGKLDKSFSSLKMGQAIAQEAKLTADEVAIQLELGNTKRSMANKAIAYGKKQDATQQIQDATKFYQKAALASFPIIQLQAQLNQLSLELDQVRWQQDSKSADELKLKTTLEKAIELWQSIHHQIDSALPSRALIYAQLNASESLIRLRRFSPQLEGTATNSWLSVSQMLENAMTQAHRLNDSIVEAYTLGQLGAVYELAGQFSDAQALTQQALLKADAFLTQLAPSEDGTPVRADSLPQSLLGREGAAQAPHVLDVRYRLEWQLGRILDKQGDRSQSIEFYKNAVETLKLVRKDLLTVDSNIQFNFRDDVERVYRELVELLLNPRNNPHPNPDELNLAINNIDELQLAELENFLGCDLDEFPLAQRTTSRKNQAEEMDKNAAIVYPVILDQYVAVILKLPNQAPTYNVSEQVSHHEVNKTLNQLQRDLRRGDHNPDAINGLKKVYQWIIAPIRNHLDPQVKTLVFVLDGQLRNIPMAALYDGESISPDGSRRHLIHDYAVAITPRASDLKLFNPEKRPSKLDLFLGGVSVSQDFGTEGNFETINFLKEEFDGIRNLGKEFPDRLDTNLPLTNAEFTRDNLEQKLSSDRFSAIHIKTHGKFSSDPEETFLVGYQEKIKGKDLGKFIQSQREVGAKPIELLTLSACETAEGDDRAVLGIAGIAVQAGTRSVVSTLWKVNDKLNTELMIEFYKHLLNPETTRAEAVRQAQLYLFKKYSRTPNAWAAYILVGNWL